MKAGVLRAWVNQIAEAKLLDVPKPLKIRMLDQIIDQLAADGDEPVNGVVDDFLFVHERFKV